MKSSQETNAIRSCDSVYVIEDGLHEEAKRPCSLVVTNCFAKSEDDVSPMNDSDSPPLMDDDVNGQSNNQSGRVVAMPSCPLECKNQDSGLESAASSWDRTLTEAKEQAVSRLQHDLKLAHEAIKMKDEQVSRLSRIRNEVEAELEELTASLFQEAHNMVREANMKQAAAEKSLRESLMKVEMLTAEVEALKALVLTSTPSKPNHHLHPHLREDSSDSKKHRRSPSHISHKNGHISPQESPTKIIRNSFDPVDAKESALEVDPITHKEFLVWKKNPTIDKTDPFIARIYREDIDYCLNFTNEALSLEVRKAIESSDVFIEAVGDKSKNNSPKTCALQDSVRHCHYRLRLGSDQTWYYISHMCRNRIIAVCDFLNYLRYIQRGLVKSSVHDVYWEIVRLRKEMVLARLGLMLTP